MERKKKEGKNEGKLIGKGEDKEEERFMKRKTISRMKNIEGNENGGGRLSYKKTKRS
jgi:hypothetical protein